MSGRLYLCATPIGNLKDITLRTLEILNKVDIIAAEDTRHSQKLLNHYEIKVPMTSYHEHNKYKKAEVLLDKLNQGKDIALITDAGTPGISDPGEELVKLCIQNEIEVTASPGPVAAITALIISGINTRRFIFEGFIPQDKKEQKKVLSRLVNETRTTIIYEAPHRLKSTLQKLYEFVGNRNICVTKELTKRHEKALKMTLSDAIKLYEAETPKGEYVLVLEGKDEQIIEREKQEKWEEITIEEHMNHYESLDYSKKDAMKAVAKDRNVSKREIYAYLNK